MTILESHPHLQAVRRVKENGDPFPTSNTIIHVVCHPDTAFGKDILLWDDILAVFSNALYIRSGTVALPFLKGPDFKNLDPLRFAAVPGVTLDVVIGDPLVRAEALSQPEPSNALPLQELPLKPLQEVLPDTAEKNSNQNPAPTLSTVVNTTKRHPVYGLENTAMDNYTHIDMPDDIKALSLRMVMGRYQEQAANTNSNSTDIAAMSATVTATAATVSPPREPVVGLKSSAMGACKNTDNPIEPPSSRGPQTLPGDQTTSTTSNNDTSRRPQNSSLRTLPPRAPQESASSATEHVARTIENARQGDRVAREILGDMYRDGNGVTQDYHQAMTWYLKSAKQGLAGAQYSVGWLYQFGKGVSQDYQQAIYWFRKAAEQGQAAAQYSLGCMYYHGEGVPQDRSLAVPWFLKAAEEGHAGAQYNLGVMYDRGLGVVQDFPQAIIWYLKAANQGDKTAQCIVGQMYQRGYGVSQDYCQAMDWYLKAAGRGCAKAQCKIGYIYSNGLGVAQDSTLAKEWYCKAADQGNAEAQHNIGVLYELGKGVEKDNAKAVEWFRKAADGGHAVAIERLDKLKRQGYGV